MSDTERAKETAAAASGGKKPYTSPTLTECGSVAKLTMAKGTTNAELGQIVRKGCL